MTLIKYGLWPETRSFESDASIVLIGARGSGKRSLGFIGATKLGRRFLTEDHYFESITGISRGDFLRKYGAADFYKQNVEVVRRMLFDNRKRCVIECGMGSFAGDAQGLLKQYAKTNPVIYVVRNLKRMSRLLKLGDHDAKRLEHADLTHRFCSNLEYYNLYDPTCEEFVKESTLERDSGSPIYSSKLKQAKQDFSMFLDFVTGSLTVGDFESPFSINAVPAELRLYTYALPIKFSEILCGQFDLDEVALDSGGDVVEIMIDIEPPESLKALAKQVALIRRKMQMPIIVSVDRVFKKNISDLAYFELLQHCLRLGVEYLAVDIASASEPLQSLISSKGRTKIIGDYFHERQNSLTAWSEDLLLPQYVKAAQLRCDLVRITRWACQGEDQESLQQFREKVRSLSGFENAPPLIAYSLGTMGHISQLSNVIFTPITAVTHSKHGGLIKEDPESLSAQEAMKALFSTHIFNPLHFYVVGASVFYSLSPAMHNAAYRISGMDHDYSIRQSSSLAELHQLTQEPHFGGAAISHPFKVGIVSELKAMSKHATAIGAVNTILPIRAFSDGTASNDDDKLALRLQANMRGRAGPVVGWYGDNTDWIGIMNCLQRNLSPRNAVQRRTTGLVIGAGGMARAAIYAMIHLGCRKIFIYNRTLRNANTVACHFNTCKVASTDGGVDGIVEVLKSLNDPWPVESNPPTLIVAAVPEHGIKDRPAANFVMPQQWLTSPSGGVVVELAYKPLMTPLLQQVQRLREAGQPWTIVNGLEILPEQGVVQFELMTGRRAPRQRMHLEILRRYEEDDQQNDDSVEDMGSDGPKLRNRFENLRC